ncbi:MAG: hypothetical protein K9L59_10125 [Desulfobacterales bacterium]|nr:hypothetical protein [Desulfobacterales bacterium]
MKIVDRIKAVERQIDLKAIRPPAFLRPFLEEDRDPGPEEAGMFYRHFERWQRAIGRAIDRGHVSLQDLQNALPEAFRRRVREAVLKRIETEACETDEAQC